ncbi:MAG: archease [Thermoleophilia bacterium]
MMQFELIEHTADIGVRSFGATIAEAFETAAAGMFSLLADPGQICDQQEFPVEVEAEDREMLLVEWLNELLYIYESRGVLLKRFHIREISDTRLLGSAYGEPIDPGRHEIRTDIKAVTYYQLRVKQRKSGWLTEVILDV